MKRSNWLLIGIAGLLLLFTYIADSLTSEETVYPKFLILAGILIVVLLIFIWGDRRENKKQK